MAEWKRTLEPYVKVQERIRTAALNPTIGEDLIVGAVFISDAGPSTPTLITSQKEFLETYASGDVTKDYVLGLNKFYTEDDELAGTMWANAYRLAGSTKMLCVRASKSDNLFYAKPLDIDGGQSDYVLKDGVLLKKIPDGFKFVIDHDLDAANHNNDGWSIAVNNIGVFGNRTTDEGAQYDYYVGNLIDLVDQLNETSMFFSPDFKFFENADMEVETSDPDAAKCVVFYEVYLAPDFLYSEKTEPREISQDACQYIIPCEIDKSEENIDQQAWIDLNSAAASGFEESKYFALNVYNSSSTLRVRIRRFNHDAVVNKQLSKEDKAELTATGSSPYTVLRAVLDTFTKNGTAEASDKVKERDFFEIAVFDPSVNEEVLFFNIGSIYGRGDMDAAELNDLLKMISLELPDDLHDLNLNYYGYDDDDYHWVKISSEEGEAAQYNTAPDFDGLFSGNITPGPGAIYKVEGGEQAGNFYRWDKNGRLDSLSGESQIFVDLSIDPSECSILNISDSDLKRAVDKIQENEVYIVEGLCDLGNTDPGFQTYLANYAISEDGNYFYPISSINSTNYMTIGNGSTKLPQDHYKLYMSAPWDIDTGTLGFRFEAAPSVLFWEGVSQNYKYNRPYASLFGQTYGKVNYQRPVVEFNKRQRELLLSKKVNTVMWNTNAQIWQMNDNYTRQTENTIMNDEGNVRMGIHIAKVQPMLLAQFIGKKITERLCADVVSVEEYFLNTQIMSLDGNAPEAFQVFCEYDPVLARQNKIKVCINIRFARSLKFVNVLLQYFDTGMDISSDM